MHSVLFHKILQEYWGYESFRPLQEDIIQSVWDGKDTLGLMPTGGGKSLTFQVPVMGMKGICLVVTPLIALMKDQVDNLRERGIKAAAVYSGMSRDEIITTLENCIFGDFKFLYVSPERLSSDIFRVKLRAMDVCLIVVDESHCISQWGYDFRPSYLKISEIRDMLEGTPVLALTATATPVVEKDIQDKLQFKEKNVFRVSFARDNLSYVVRDADNKLGELIHILESVSGSSIVYVRSRQGTHEIARALQKVDISADFFHAGLSQEQKILKQDAWRCGGCRVMVATNAFGMGIDKPDVRTVIHMDLPNSPEEYYQEAGRAGRDGERSYSIILYSKADSGKLKKRISDSFPDRDFTTRVYEALGNYYQVAVGSGFNSVYDFSLYEFCSSFKLPSLQTHHALKILELAGYIEYTEEIETRSRIRFLIYRDDMYSLQLDKDTENLLHNLLRNYTGVFSDDVYIDESLLAARIGKSRQAVYDILVSLARARYIRYVPRKKTPFIVFTTAREDTSFVIISHEIYEKRRHRFENRINSMIDYAEGRSTCRSRMLLIYFGEERADDCGICDICLERNKTGLSNYEFRKLERGIKKMLVGGEPKRIKELMGEREDNNEKVLLVIRFLVDEGDLALKDDKVWLVNK